MKPAWACGMGPYETARGLSDWFGGDDPPLEKAREIGDCEDLDGCTTVFAVISADAGDMEDESGDGAELP